MTETLQGAQSLNCDLSTGIPAGMRQRTRTSSNTFALGRAAFVALHVRIHSVYNLHVAQPRRASHATTATGNVQGAPSSIRLRVYASPLDAHIHMASCDAAACKQLSWQLRRPTAQVSTHLYMHRQHHAATYQLLTDGRGGGHQGQRQGQVCLSHTATHWPLAYT